MALSKAELLQRFYDDLHIHFGDLNWWPADTPWEVCVGVVLVQNTNWKNVETTIQNLKDVNKLDASSILELEHDELAQLIKPSGYFNVKSKRLKAVAKWWLQRANQIDQSVDLKSLRTELLAVYGLGEESVDSIMLYAFNLPVFVVDAYTRRIFSRHLLVNKNVKYTDLQKLFTDHLSENEKLFNNYHALIVNLGKKFCQTKPKCDNCPLAWHLEI